jgi:hypothetical protein
MDTAWKPGRWYRMQITICLAITLSSHAFGDDQQYRKAFGADNMAADICLGGSGLAGPSNGGQITLIPGPASASDIDTCKKQGKSYLDKNSFPCPALEQRIYYLKMASSLCSSYPEINKAGIPLRSNCLKTANSNFHGWDGVEKIQKTCRGTLSTIVGGLTGKPTVTNEELSSCFRRSLTTDQENLELKLSIARASGHLDEKGFYSDQLKCQLDQKIEAVAANNGRKAIIGSYGDAENGSVSHSDTNGSQTAGPAAK